MDTIRYNGYDGSIEVSEDDNLFFGKILGIKSLISYEGKTPEEFLDNFHGAIDNYLETCKKEGKKTEVPDKGSYKTSRFNKICREFPDLLDGGMNRPCFFKKVSKYAAFSI